MATEQRKSERKLVKTKALAAFDGTAPVAGRTVDISLEGVSVSFADPVEAGKRCYVRFDLLIDGKRHTVTARARAQYCIFSQGEFKVGFQFLEMDPAGANAVKHFMR